MDCLAAPWILSETTASKPPPFAGNVWQSQRPTRLDADVLPAATVLPHNRSSQCPLAPDSQLVLRKTANSGNRCGTPVIPRARIHPESCGENHAARAAASNASCRFPACCNPHPASTAAFPRNTSPPPAHNPASHATTATSRSAAPTWPACTWESRSRHRGNKHHPSPGGPGSASEQRGVLQRRDNRHGAGLTSRAAGWGVWLARRPTGQRRQEWRF